ncbi:MAG: hypothetical protein M3R68_10895 [Acidobacteriota bacterium]|nr:hypothetical protein [Acidobacteriota bacterium]
MKRNEWLSTLFALTLILACVLGCGNSATTSPSTSARPTTSSPSQTVAPTPAEIAGSYDVAGTNENGSPYKGELEIIKHGEAYQFRWNAGKQYDGVGVQNGGVVAVAFTEGADGKGCGVVTYKVLVDGALDGKWGYWGVNEAGTEKATRTSGSELAGTYDIAGKNPNGSVYKGKLSIAPEAGGYKFAWDNGSGGFGIKQGDTVSVGIGGSRCAFVAYEIKGNGMLDGIWGGYGSQKTGTEKATKK